MRRRRALIATGCLLLGGCGSAATAGEPGARPPTGRGVDIQAVFGRHGNPVLGANFVPNGALAKPRWSICAPGAACRRTGHRGLLKAGRTARGTVFQAAATYRGRTYVARTPPWRGTVRPIAPPRLDGAPAVGATVRPVAGRWRGGWGGELDLLHVEACRTSDARDCVTLSAEGEDYRGSHRSAVVHARYAGWFLFALDRHFARDTAFAGVGYGSPADIPPLRTGPTVSRSAPVGPVT